MCLLEIHSQANTIYPRSRLCGHHKSQLDISHSIHLTIPVRVIVQSNSHDPHRNAARLNFGTTTGLIRYTSCAIVDETVRCLYEDEDGDPETQAVKTKSHFRFTYTGAQLL